jgi:hypothetical protein
MNEAAGTKVCPFCAETIKAAAKVCPFCQRRLTKFALQQQDLSTVFVGLLLIGSWIGFAIWADNHFDPSEQNFAAHRNELEVLQTSIEQARQTPSEWVDGLETNAALQKSLNAHVGAAAGFSKIPASLEVRFVDSDGNLLNKHEAESNVMIVKPDFWLSGVITNKGTRPWYAGELEIRFFDARTNLVDTQHLDPHHLVRVEPHKSSAFRQLLDRYVATNSGSFFRVRVQDASDADIR